jgi:outer membrane protein insertion porin family
MLDLAPGTEVSSGGIRYRHPDLFGSHFDRWSADVELRRTRQFFRSYRQGGTRAEFDLGRAFGFNHAIEFGPVFATLDTDEFDEDDVLPDTLLNSEGKREYYGFGLDYRYQDLDNRRVPSEGIDIHSRNTYYGGFLGGDEDFTKSELTFDAYMPFGENKEDARPGLYVGVAGGVAYPRGDSDTEIYGERFFLGGASTLRGFDFRGVGPFVDANGKQSDIPIGGETYVRGSFELRFPLYTVPQPGTTFRREMFRGTLFLDWGVLDPNALEIAVNETRVSAGFGFGLAYPIPLTFNFGWPLKKGVGDDPEVFSFRLTIR